MCVCYLARFGGSGNILVRWQPLLLSLHLLGNWIKIIVFRIAGPYIILRQITNLPQLRTSAATGQLRTFAATGQNQSISSRKALMEKKERLVLSKKSRHLTVFE